MVSSPLYFGVSDGMRTDPDKNASPVDDISGLDKEIHLTGPSPFFINDPGHFQHLPSISEISMKVADGNYPTDERILWQVPLDVRGMMDDGRGSDQERLLVTFAELLGGVWPVIFTSELLVICLG